MVLSRELGLVPIAGWVGRNLAAPSKGEGPGVHSIQAVHAEAGGVFGVGGEDAPSLSDPNRSERVMSPSRWSRYHKAMAHLPTPITLPIRAN